jgi:transposase
MEKQYPTKYPSDVSDEEWSFVAPYLTLCREDAPQREHALRAVFNGLRYIVRSGNQWRFMPGDLPPWTAVYQQTQRWMRAGVFEILVEDVRSLLREFAGRKPQPTAMIVDSRTLQSTPESGARAGYDGAKRRKGSKVHAAVDTLGHLLALHVTAASEQDRQRLRTTRPLPRRVPLLRLRLDHARPAHKTTQQKFITASSSLLGAALDGEGVCRSSIRAKRYDLHRVKVPLLAANRASWWLPRASKIIWNAFAQSPKPRHRTTEYLRTLQASPQKLSTTR